MAHSAAPIDPFASASTMLATLQMKQLSATALLEHHLWCIERYNEQINAIVVPNCEQAQKQVAEAAYTRGESLEPQHGLPVTIMDCIEVTGLRTRAAIAERAHTISTQNGPVAQRV